MDEPKQDEPVVAEEAKVEVAQEQPEVKKPEEAVAEPEKVHDN